MQLLHNASALATGASKNLNCSSVDANRREALLQSADALAEAIKGMRARGELEIAQRLYAEFRQARQSANNIARRIGAEEI